MRGYIVAGHTTSFGAGAEDFYLIRTDGAGDTVWTRTYGGPNFDDAASVAQTSDGGHIVAGSTDSYGAGEYDVYVIKTNGEGFVHMSGDEDEIRRRHCLHLGRNQPTPFRATTRIEHAIPDVQSVFLAIYNVRGARVRTLVSGWMPARTYQITWDGRDLRKKRVSSEMYFWGLLAGDQSETRRMVLLR